MYKRIQSIILFAVIGLLLTAKAGLNIWHSTANDIQQNIVQAVNLSEPSQAGVELEMLPFAVAQDTAADSLALLEAYLIPEANAEVTGSTPNPVIEDETLASLRQYKQELDQRSKELDDREKTMQEAEDQLKRRVTELEQLEASIQQRLLDESKVKSKKIKRLTAVYEGMKPERAAPVIEKMELATVVKIFLLMDEKKVGKILSFLPPEKAVKISQALTRQISSVK